MSRNKIAVVVPSAASIQMLLACLACTEAPKIVAASDLGVPAAPADVAADPANDEVVSVTDVVAVDPRSLIPESAFTFKYPDENGAVPIVIDPYFTFMVLRKPLKDLFGANAKLMPDGSSFGYKSYLVTVEDDSFWVEVSMVFGDDGCLFEGKICSVTYLGGKAKKFVKAKLNEALERSKKKLDDEKAQISALLESL